MNAVSVEDALHALRELGADARQHIDGDLAAHLHGTYLVLRDWGGSVDLCLAGLYHSVYGTDGYSHQLVSANQRQSVAALIGERSEAIVYLYCAALRLDLYPRIVATDRPLFRDRFTDTVSDLDETALSEFCELTVANEWEIERRTHRHFQSYDHVFGDLFRSERFQRRISGRARDAMSSAVPA